MKAVFFLFTSVCFSVILITFALQTERHRGSEIERGIVSEREREAGRERKRERSKPIYGSRIYVTSKLSHVPSIKWQRCGPFKNGAAVIKFVATAVDRLKSLVNRGNSRALMKATRRKPCINHLLHHSTDTEFELCQCHAPCSVGRVT